MRFMVIVPGDSRSEAGEMPDESLFSAMTKYNEELVKAGVMLAGEGLHPTSKGARVRFDAGKKTVVDGPFTESKELVAGFWLWECKSKEEAIEWVKRAPFGGGVSIEIRQVMESAEIPVSDDVREREAKLREQIKTR